MKYVVANTQNLCALSENRLEEFIKEARPAIIKKDGKVIVGFSHNDIIYRFAGNPLDYRTWRELFHKSPRFRSMVFNLFSTFGKAQYVESSEILDEVLTDSEGNRSTYWLLAKIMGEYAEALSDESVRNALNSTLNQYIASKGKQADSSVFANALVQFGVPANAASKIASYFDPTQSQVVTVNDAIRMLNNTSPTFKNKYSDEQIQERMEKAQLKAEALSSVLNKMLSDLGGKPAAEQQQIKDNTVEELVATGYFTRPQARKYVEKAAPVNKKMKPKAVQDIVKPLGQPFVGSMMETGTPYLHDYYKAFQEFVDAHPEHGPAVARQVARSIFEHPSEGLPATLTEKPYPTDYIRNKGDEQLKKIISENESFIREAGKSNLVADIAASEDFQKEFGISLEDVVRVAGKYAAEQALDECAGHHVYIKLAEKNSNIREAGISNTIRTGLEKKFVTYLMALHQAFIKDRRYEKAHKIKPGTYEENLKSIPKNSKYSLIAMIIERVAFRASMIDAHSDAVSMARDYANKATEKLTNMGKIGLFILMAMGVIGAVNSGFAGTAVEPSANPFSTPTDVVQPPTTPDMSTPNITPFDMPDKTSFNFDDNIRLAQTSVDMLGTLEQQTMQEIQAIFSNPQLKNNPQALQSAIANLTKSVANKLQPMYAQLKDKAPIAGMSNNILEELNSQRIYFNKKNQQQGANNGKTGNIT